MRMCRVFHRGRLRYNDKYLGSVFRDINIYKCVYKKIEHIMILNILIFLIFNPPFRQKKMHTTFIGKTAK